MALQFSDPVPAAAAPPASGGLGCVLFRSRLHDGVFLAVLAAASIEFAILRLHYGFEDPGATFARLIAGTADTPFQYRFLIPLIARGLIALAGLAHHDLPLKALFMASDSLFMFASLLMATLTLKTLDLTRPQILAAILGLGVIIDTNYFATEALNALHVYDLPAVFFAFLETHLLLRGRVGAFYTVLPFALLNRETAVFLCLLFLLTQIGRMPWSRLLAHMTAQGAVVLAIKAATTALFAHNPGAGPLSLYTTDFTATGAAAHRLGDLRILENLRIFVSPRRLLHMSSVFGFLWVPYLFALSSLTSPFFKAAAWVFPAVFALMLVVGNLDEFRIYSELIPPLFFTVALGWAEWMRREGDVGV
jgi:hypothetical protein